MPKANIHDVAELNSHSTNWKYPDFAQCFAVQDNEHYKTIIKKKEEHGFGWSVLMSLLQNGTVKTQSRSDADKDFKSGKFKVKHLDQFEKVAELCKDFKPYIAYPHRRNFVELVLKLIASENYNHKDMISQIKRVKLEHKIICDTWKEYLLKLEDIAGFRKQKRVTLI